MKRYLYLLILVFFCLSANIYAQSEARESLLEENVQQKKEFEALRNKLDYGDTKSVWRLKEIEQEEPEEVDFDIDPAISGPNFNGGFTNILAYALIILLIMAVIFMIVSSVKLNKKIKPEEKQNDYIEDIEEIDALTGFKKALLAGDYRSAIRMQFIKVLQILQEKNKINWRPEKTNKDYIREISDTAQKQTFRKLSGIYEFVWYGNTSIDKENFKALNPAFDQFINAFDEV